MQQIILNVNNESKAKSLIEFLKQIDFIDIKQVIKDKKFSQMENEIKESLNDLKKGNVSSWKNKEINLKNG